MQLLVFLSFSLFFVRAEDITVECLNSDALKYQFGGLAADCSYKGLTRLETIFPWLTSISPILQVVNASNNHILKLSKFPLLPRLLTLTLRYNGIKELEAKAVVDLINLQTLDLSYNRITGESLRADVLRGRFAPDRYEPLPIRTLLLGHNDIHSLNRRVFEHLPYLRELRLDNNPIISLDTVTTIALQSLPELKILDLAKTGLSFLPDDAFHYLELSTLYLNGNNFKQVPDALAALGSTLRYLNINQNPIEELNDNSFLGLRNLREIVASGLTELQAVKAGTFSRLEDLKVVSCSYNPKLVFIDRLAFWDQSNNKRFSLKEVYLNNNGIQRISKYLLPWNKMEKVTLDGNPWVCDCRLYWLAQLVRSKGTTIDRPYNLQCSEPIWLNGMLLMYVYNDTHERPADFSCEEDPIDSRVLMNMQLKQAGHKFLNTLIVAGLLAAIIAVIVAAVFYRYRHYRPLNIDDKLPTPLSSNKMKYVKGNMTETTHLVS